MSLSAGVGTKAALNTPFPRKREPSNNRQHAAPTLEMLGAWVDQQGPVLMVLLQQADSRQMPNMIMMSRHSLQPWKNFI